MNKLQELAVFCDRLYEMQKVIITMLEQGSAPVFRGVCALDMRRQEMEQRMRQITESFGLNQPIKKETP